MLVLNRIQHGKRFPKKEMTIVLFSRLFLLLKMRLIVYWKWNGNYKPHILKETCYVEENETDTLTDVDVVVILSFSIAPASKTQAKASDPSDVVVLQGEQAARFTEATVDAITKGSAKHIADNSALNDKEATVYTVGGGVTVVTIPLNESYSLPSNITVFFMKKNRYYRRMKCRHEK